MEKDRVIHISMMNKGTNDIQGTDFIIPGEYLINKSTKELKEFFASEARNAFEKMLKSEKITPFISDKEKR